MVGAAAATRTPPPPATPRLEGVLPASGRVEIVVELLDPPAAISFATALRDPNSAPLQARAQAAVAARQQLTRIEAAQRTLIVALAAPPVGAKVIYAVQRVYNGVTAVVNAGALDAIAHMPGVKAVHRLPTMFVGNTSSVPLIGAPAVWNASGLNATGAGVRIGILDTGIDYIHKDFGGSGNYQGQSYTDANVPWTAKVVGGYDFVGDAYGSSDFASVDPDPDPMDNCNGHGTHVAGTAAGYGVTADGSTYSGPYGPGTDFSSLRIGPGVAPGAQLYALKVGGCDGRISGSALLKALDWAVDPNQDGDLSDHLDVINMSLGSKFGDSGDAIATASDNAALAGASVVAVAGNDGDTYCNTWSPGVASRAIAAASSVDSTAITGGFKVIAPASIAGAYPAAEAQFGPDLAKAGDATGGLLYPTTNQNGCSSFAAGTFTSKIALIDRGACTFVAKVKNAQLGGATGVLIANNVAGYPFTMGGADASITIPSMLTTKAAGDSLKGALAAGAVTVTLTASQRNAFRNVDAAAVDTLSSFSSLGPRRGDSLLKPDITAPGDTIFSAATLTGDQGMSDSGTSMASPHITGTIALLRQLHPDWSVEELKAVVMNTASHDVFRAVNGTPPVYGPGRVGAGRVDVALAAATPAVAFNADGSGSVSVSFGALEVLADTTWTKSVKVVNKGAASVTYQLAYAPYDLVPGATYDFPDGPSVTVPAGGSETFHVRLTAQAALLEHTHDPALSETQLGYPRHWLTEAAGFVTLTPASGPTLRVPVHAVIRPASAMAASLAQPALTANTGSFSLDLAGTGVSTGSDYPAAEDSLVSAFELQLIAPAHANGTVGDLGFVGAASDYAATVAGGGGIADSWIYFGVATQANWTTPNEVEVYIEIDTDGNGSANYTLTSGDATGSTGSDVFTVTFCPGSSSGSGCLATYLNNVDASFQDTVLFNTNAMVLPVSAGWLGLPEGHARFNYRVSVAVRDRAGSSTGWLTFDATHPGLSFGGVDFDGAPVHQPLYLDAPGESIPIQYDVPAFVANGSLGVLLLHHHNTTGNRAQALALAGQTDMGVAITASPDPANVGDNVSYTLTATNHGPLAAGGVTVADTIPSGTTYISATPSQGTCSGLSHLVCDLGVLDAGGAVTLVVVVKTKAAGSLTDTATVTSSWSDPNPANDSASVTTTVGTPGAAAPSRIPSVAHTSGAGGTVWRTDVAAVNRSGSAGSLTLVYVSDTQTITRTASLANGATAGWSDILVSLFGLAGSAKSSGALAISSDVPLEIVSRTYNQGAAGTYGQYYPALATAEAIPAGGVGVLPMLAKNASTRTNVGIQNLGDASSTVAVKVFNAQGAQVGSSKTITAGAGKWAQLNDVFAATGAGNQDLAYATVEVQTANAKVWAYASVIDATTGDPTTIPVLLGSTTGPYRIPSVAHTSGTGGTVWRTDVAAVNRSGSAGSLTLVYTSDTQTITRTASLANGATVGWSDILVSLFGLAGSAKSSGALAISSDVPLEIVSRTYNQGAAGTYGQYYPALAAGDAMPAAAVGVLPMLAKNASTRTNIGVQNLGEVSCTVGVKVFNAAGAQVGNTKTISAGAGKWAQLNDVFAATGAGNQDLAYATVEVQTANGKVWAYASVIDAATGDPTTIGVIVPGAP